MPVEPAASSVDDPPAPRALTINYRFTGALLYSGEASSIAELLRAAIMDRADLSDADLRGSDLSGAINAPTVPEATEPHEPYRRAASEEERRRRALARMARYRERHPEVPVVEALDRRIWEEVNSGHGKLEMSQWHSPQCTTTHCRAGFAIALAGKAGWRLEEQYGPHRAGAMIYRASTGRVPQFFASNEAALADIRACAEAQ